MIPVGTLVALIGSVAAMRIEPSEPVGDAQHDDDDSDCDEDSAIAMCYLLKLLASSTNAAPEAHRSMSCRSRAAPAAAIGAAFAIGVFVGALLMAFCPSFSASAGTSQSADCSGDQWNAQFQTGSPLSLSSPKGEDSDQPLITIESECWLHESQSADADYRTDSSAARPDYWTSTGYAERIVPGLHDAGSETPDGKASGHMYLSEDEADVEMDTLREEIRQHSNPQGFNIDAWPNVEHGMRTTGAHGHRNLRGRGSPSGGGYGILKS